MNDPSRRFAGPVRKAPEAVPRAPRAALCWGAAALLLLAAPALSDPAAQEPPAAEAADGSGCRVLTGVYRRLQDAPAVPEAERRRLVNNILNTCATVDAQLVRATTLDGAPVLQLPLATAFDGAVRP